MVLTKSKYFENGRRVTTSALPNVTFNVQPWPSPAQEGIKVEVRCSFFVERIHQNLVQTIERDGEVVIMGHGLTPAIGKEIQVQVYVPVKSMLLMGGTGNITVGDILGTVVCMSRDAIQVNLGRVHEVLMWLNSGSKATIDCIYGNLKAVLGELGLPGVESLDIKNGEIPTLKVTMYNRSAVSLDNCTAGEAMIFFYEAGSVDIFQCLKAPTVIRDYNGTDAVIRVHNGSVC